MSDTSRPRVGVGATSPRREESDFSGLFTKLASSLVSPAVLTALITTVFGSFAVAYVTTQVNKAINDRKIQYDLVTALMDYTADPNLAEISALARLEALTGLVEDNDQFEVSVEGFKTMLADLRNTAETELKRKLVTKNGDIEQLQEEKEILIASGEDKAEAIDALQARIDKKQAGIDAAASRLATLRAEGDTAREELQGRYDELDRRASSLQEDLDAAQTRARELEATLTPISMTIGLPEIRCLSDGAGGPTPWVFRVLVNAQPVLDIREQDYDDDDPVVIINGTGQFQIRPGEPVVVQVIGIRSGRTVIGTWKLDGRSSEAWAAAAESTTVPATIHEDPGEGDFQVDLHVRATPKAP